MPEKQERREESGRPDAAHDVWQYREDLQRLASYLCRHPHDAEDVAHNALVKAAEKLDGFRGESSVRTWLHTITTNECRMLRRRKTPSPIDDVFEHDEAGAALGRSLDPEEIAEELETRREVLDAIAELPTRSRCAVMLRDGQGLSLEEVARLMDTSVPAVKSLLFRARNDIRQRVAAGMR